MIMKGQYIHRHGKMKGERGIKNRLIRADGAIVADGEEVLEDDRAGVTCVLYRKSLLLPKAWS